MKEVNLQRICLLDQKSDSKLSCEATAKTTRGVRAGLSLTCSLIIDIAFSMINLYRGPHGRRLHTVVLRTPRTEDPKTKTSISINLRTVKTCRNASFGAKTIKSIGSSFCRNAPQTTKRRPSLKGFILR